MEGLARVREEIQCGHCASAEAILDGILERPEEVTSHFLFDLDGVYEDLFRVTGR